MSKLKKWDELDADTQKTCAWHIMRYIEEKIPREIATTSVISSLMLAVSTLPNLNPETGEVKFAYPEQKQEAMQTILALVNLFRILFVTLAEQGTDVPKDLRNLCQQEGVDPENITRVLPQVSQLITGKYLGFENC